MKLFKTIMLAILLAPSVSTGQIFGSLKEDGRSLGNVKFEVICKDAIYAGMTDAYGAYSINAGRGKCVFRLYYKDQIPTYEIYPKAQALRYDFNVVVKKGSYLLRRK